jgi:hypothetical protein
MPLLVLNTGIRPINPSKKSFSGFYRHSQAPLKVSSLTNNAGTGDSGLFRIIQADPRPVDTPKPVHGCLSFYSLKNAQTLPEVTFPEYRLNIV